MSTANTENNAPRTRSETVFVVIHGEQGTPLRYWNIWEEGREYATAAEAQEQARRWANTYTAFANAPEIRFAIRAITREAEIPLEEQEWFQRELSRFASGEYKSLPEAFLAAYPISIAFGTDPYWRLSAGFGRLKHHLAHMSIKQPGNIAFTESIEKGERDIQTSLTPRRYLERYFSFEAVRSALGEGVDIGAADYLRPEEIDRLVDLLSGDETFTLTITKDQDEIERVYTYGPRSCMGGPLGDARTQFKDADYFSTGGIHPSRVYGGDSSSGLAYLTRDGRYTARAVVDTERKIYGSTYGDGARLKRMLEAQGYEEGSLEGTTINLIETYSGKFVCPYIDETQRVDYYSDKFLVISSDGAIHAGFTDGLAYEGEECDNCGEITETDDLTYVRGHGHWCPDCVMYHAFTCDDCGETFHEGDAHSTEDGSVCHNCVDDYVYSEYMGCYIHHDSAFQCPDCGEYYPDYHEHVSDHDDLARCRSCHDDHVYEVAEQREAEQELATIAPEYCTPSSDVSNVNAA